MLKFIVNYYSKKNRDNVKNDINLIITIIQKDELYQG